MRRCVAIVAGLVVVSAALGAQAAPPSTDIYLVRLRGAGSAIADPPQDVTHRDGYDNQPAFTPDGRWLLFTSIHEDGQADTYRLDLASRAIARLTDTPESEYSPTPMPNGAGFSVVRVERDSAQRLWAFNADGRAPVLLLPGVAPVGYHVWLDDHTLALFVLGTPNTLQLADTHTGDARVIARDIGQSLQAVPGGNRFSFLQHTDSATWLETADASATGDVQRVAIMPKRAGYVVWESPTSVLTAAGTEILRLDLSRGAAAAWVPIADFTEDGLRNISRLAISPDGRWLALVAIPAGGQPPARARRVP